MLLSLIRKVTEVDADGDYTASSILTNDQMRMADQLTIEAGTDGYDLMLSAGQAIANVVHKHYLAHKVLILCGPGNNGGDGYVAAGFLKEMGFEVYVMGLVAKRKYKGDAALAVKEWTKTHVGKIHGFKSLPDMNIDKSDKVVVVDALFGTGLSKALDSKVVDIFSKIREKKWPIVAVDIPSGVNGDDGSADKNTLIADHTVTFFKKKIGHVLIPGLEKSGEVSVHDIGIEEDVLDVTGYAAKENVTDLWQECFPQKGAADHKYKNGHIVILGGSEMTGAARMAGQAAMRLGAGLCTIAADKKAMQIYKVELPHILNEQISKLSDFTSVIDDERKNTVLLGPGAGLKQRDELCALVVDVLKTGKTTILDADALSCFEGRTEELFAVAHDKVVLTPHEGEFKRLFPEIAANESLNKIEKTQAACNIAGCNILYKGADTVIAGPNIDKAVINTHASVWLATAGAGDVLAGMIASLCAQGMSAFEACCAAAWIHGEAALKFGPGLTAPDIIEEIPSILYEIT